MCDRLKTLRKSLGFTQHELGRRLGIGNAAVSKIENGENALTEQNIKLLCKEFRVREQWLRTGEGDMYEADPQADIMDFIGGLMRDNHDSFKQRLISALARLDTRDWEVLEKLVEQMGKKEGDA